LIEFYRLFPKLLPNSCYYIPSPLKINSVAASRHPIHPDFALVVVGYGWEPDRDDKNLVLLEIDNNCREREVTSWDHGTSSSSVAISPDGNFILTGSYQSAAKLWKIKWWKVLEGYKTKGVAKLIC